MKAKSSQRWALLARDPDSSAISRRALTFARRPGPGRGRSCSGRPGSRPGPPPVLDDMLDPRRSPSMFLGPLRPGDLRVGHVAPRGMQDSGSAIGPGGLMRRHCGLMQPNPQAKPRVDICPGPSQPRVAGEASPPHPGRIYFSKMDASGRGTLQRLSNLVPCTDRGPKGVGEGVIAPRM